MQGVYRGRQVDFSTHGVVMAIINRTPDSFHDQGRTFTLEAALNAGLQAVRDGAEWLDIGGVPFSPDRPPVSAAEEADRVVPLIEALHARTDALISVDTTRVEVARAAIDAGAAIINDTSCLRDAGLADLVASSGAGLVLTHSLARPFEKLPRPQYGNVTADVLTTLTQRHAQALAAGVRPEQIIIDPGPDLNKTTRHTLRLMADLGRFTDLGRPVLAAISNKDFIGETLDRPRGERGPGTIAVATWALAAGARILRMHDIPAAVDAVRMFEALMGWRDPAIEEHNL